MGKGDRKTKRGKIIKGSYGRLRPRKKNKSTAPAPAEEAEEVKEVEAVKEAEKTED